MAIRIIVAMDRNGGIGNKNKLPWGDPIPADIRRFKELTLGKIIGEENSVIMGRRTWEALPQKYKPLPGRKNFVLTRDLKYTASNAYTVYNFDPKNIIFSQPKARDIWVIGGAEIYSLFEPHASEMYITIVEAEFEVDTYFPSYDRVGWKETLPTPLSFVAKGKESPYNLRFVRLTRTTPTA